MTDSKTVVAEVWEPDESLPADLLALRRFAYFMDQVLRVPGTSVRFGLDAILGLVPGIGTAAGAILSTWIVLGALRHRVPKLRVTQMVVNILVDLTISSVPFIGDAFKLVFQESVINLRLLMRYRNRMRPPRKIRHIALATAVILMIILTACALVVLGVVVLLFWVIQRYW
jgi:hypothetical protein